MASGKRESVLSLLVCSSARPPSAVLSTTTVHCPGPPLPVRANAKFVGAVPGLVSVNVIISAPASEAATSVSINATMARTQARAESAEARTDIAGGNEVLPQDMSHLLGGARQHLAACS